MDKDLIRACAESLSDSVDNAMADWEDAELGYEASAFNKLCHEWIDEHSGNPDYHDPSSEASWEAAVQEVDNAVYNEMLTDRGWVLRFEAFKAARTAVTVTAAIAVMVGFIIGRL